MLCGLLTPDAGQGTCLGYDILTEQDEIKRNVGYMTQRFSLYADLSIRENLEFVARVYGVKDPKGAGAAGHRPAWAHQPQGPARRRAVGRLEAAAGARRLHPARAASAAARRADRRRRSQGTARILGRDPRPRRRGHHRAGLHPLHGRGRALPRDRLHRLRRAARPGHGARGGRPIGLEHLDRLRRRSAPARRRASGLRRHRHGGAVRRRAACLRPRQAGARYRDRGGQEGRRRPSLDARRALAWRTCSSC